MPPALPLRHPCMDLCMIPFSGMHSVPPTRLILCALLLLPCSLPWAFFFARRSRTARFSLHGFLLGVIIILAKTSLHAHDAFLYLCFPPSNCLFSSPLTSCALHDSQFANGGPPSLHDLLFLPLLFKRCPLHLRVFFLQLHDLHMTAPACVMFFLLVWL